MTAEATATALIREVEPADYARVAELTAAAYVVGEHMAPDDSYMGSVRDVASRAQAATVLVAEVEGVVAASAAVTDHDGPYAELSRPGEIEFRFLAVDPAYQGRGLARLLVRHIVALAQARPGIDAVTLCSLDSMTAAHALYRSEGFTTDPDRDLVITLEQHGKDGRFPFFIRKV